MSFFLREVGQMKCEECGAEMRRVGTWAGIWIMACTQCQRTVLWIRYAECKGG